MRLWLASRFILLRRHGSKPLAKHALSETASTSDVNRRLLSSFNAAWPPPSVQKKRSCPGSNGIAPACAEGGHVLLRPSYNPILEFLRAYRDGYRGPPVDGEQVVTVSSEVWRLLKEYDVPATITKVLRVRIHPTQTTPKEVQLTLRGRKADAVATMLADPPLKMDVHERVTAWLLAEGPRGRRGIDIQERSGTLVQIEKSRDRRSVLLVGSAEATLATKGIIDECDCIEEFEIDNFVGFYLINDDAIRLKRFGIETDALISPVPAVGATKWKAEVAGPTESVRLLRSKLNGLHVKRHRVTHAVRSWLNNPGKGVKDARSLVLDRKFKTRIQLPPLTDDVDPASMVELVVLGESKQNVDDVLALIGGLHIKHGQISQAVNGWLTNISKGASSAREMELNRKFDTHIQMGALSDDKDPARMMAYAVVGESEENVDQVLATIAGIVVEKVKISELQAEFLMGHEDGQNRNRSHHKLEDTTDTFIGMDFDASCLHVTGRPKDVERAVDRIRKNRHIKLRTGPAELSLAAGNYVARIRPKLENEEHLQIHLRTEGMRPGTCELRRLHRVDCEQDDANADKADEKLMQAIDLHEVVLDVHKSSTWFLHERCRQVEASEGVGLGVSNDAVNGRVLVNIAGSRDTVKRGRDAVIKMLARERPQWVSDIRLRRIQGQSVDAAGFEEAGEVSEEDLSNCKESFDWERLTREQWRYTGRSSSERKRTPSTKPKQNKASENAKMDGS